MIKHPRAPQYAALIGLATGLAFGTASGERAIFSYIPAVEELTPRLPDDPMPVLTHAGMALATREAQTHLDAGRPWAAWKSLRGYVKDPAEAPEQVVVLAARAAAGWDGWSQVRRLLQGREWLAKRVGGEGLYLLARADEAKREWASAAAGYRRYLANERAEHRAEAAARLGRALARANDSPGAAEAYALAAREGGEGADWMHALEAEARVRAKDADAARAAAAASASAPVRLRLARAETRLWLDRGDTARALARLAAEQPILSAAAAAPEAAEVALEHARLLQASGRDAEARADLRRVAADSRAPASLRMRAATRLGEMPGTRTVDEELARAAAYEAGKRPGLAARALRSALRPGAPDEPAQRLRLGKLLFEERDFRPAREALTDAAERLADPALAGEAELLAARALVRLGSDEGYAELRRLVEKRPGTAVAGTALFLLGDVAENRETAIAYYRRAADVAASPDAQEALYRVGDRRLKNKDPAGAAAAWEQYANRYPTGERTAEAAYRAGVLHERAGRDEKARALYGAAIAADPASYYAIRAADRLGADPLAAALARRSLDAAPGDAREAAAALARLATLDRAGLADEWKQELGWQERRLDRRPAALLALAEGLRDAGHPVEGIRMGRALLARRGGEWDARLLRVVFPFPFRDLLEDEAKRVDVDPYLLAGLVRQESSFNPRARSWVGATGLSQIMPATGQWLAPGAGVSSFDPSLLAVPEINLRMGARYLRDQLRRYGGKRDLALAAYNAGPSRADRWRRELGYGGDPDAFREKIPFDETREYVKLVLRNAVVYRRLYGGGRSPGLSAGGS
jgi:soluble lytic murein transglycosylase